VRSFWRYRLDMPRLARVVLPGVPHPVTQRGNRRQQTFFSDDYYEAYLALMAEWCPRRGVESSRNLGLECPGQSAYPGGSGLAAREVLKAGGSRVIKYGVPRLGEGLKACMAKHTAA